MLSSQVQFLHAPNNAFTLMKTAGVSAFGMTGTNAHALMTASSARIHSNGCDHRPKVAYHLTSFDWWPPLRTALLGVMPHQDNKSVSEHTWPSATCSYGATSQHRVGQSQKRSGTQWERTWPSATCSYTAQHHMGHSQKIVKAMEYHVLNFYCSVACIEHLYNCLGTYTVGRGQQHFGSSRNTNSKVFSQRVASSSHTQIQNQGRWCLEHFSLHDVESSPDNTECSQTVIPTPNAQLQLRSMSTIGELLDTINPKYKHKFLAGFENAGYEELADLQAVHPTLEEITEWLAPLGAKKPQIARIMNALPSGDPLLMPEKANMQPGDAAALVLGGTRQAVAVVSMRCRLPGGVESASELWEMLHAGGQAIISPPKFWALETNEAPHLRFGAFLPEDTKRRDSSLLVMLARSAMSDAKATHNVHLLLCSLNINDTEVAGLVSTTAISRCETVDHISTSSHVALHTACERLNRDKCEVAIVAASDLFLSTAFHQWSWDQGLLSPRGQINAFDQTADGTVYGEACVGLALRRAADTEPGVEQHALILGSAVVKNREGSRSYFPDQEAEETAILEALKVAGVKPGDIRFTEMVANGTVYGDDAELDAVYNVLGTCERRNPLVLGGFNANIGHATYCCGLISTIKAALTLRHKAALPHINLTQPTEHIQSGRLIAPIHCFPLEDDCRYGSIHGHATSGVNVHLIIAPPPQTLAARKPVRHTQSGTQEKAQLVQTLQTCIHNLAGQEIGTSEPVMEALGMKSADALRLWYALQDQLGTAAAALPKLLVFDYPTLDQMANHMLSRDRSKKTSIHAPAVHAQWVQRPLQQLQMSGANAQGPGKNNSNRGNFWRSIYAGTTLLLPISEQRANLGYTSQVYCRHGHFMVDIELFDNAHFCMSAAEARAVDPHQRLLLQSTYEAFMNAQYARETLVGLASGVFVAADNFAEWQQLRKATDTLPSAYSALGMDTAAASGRISYLLGLKGPCCTINTACSSSLVALDVAYQNMQLRRCKNVLVAAANLLLHPESWLGLCLLTALSPDGLCKTFDVSQRHPHMS